MNKFLRIMLCAALLTTALAETAQAKKHRVRQKQIYMIGVAMSFVDSTVYITDMQSVDSVTIEHKTKFLMDRQLYSIQFQRYLMAQGQGTPSYVTSVYFGEKKKRMERRYLSLYKRYSKRNDLRLNLVDKTQFQFRPEVYYEQQHAAEYAQKSSKSKKKKAK